MGEQLLAFEISFAGIAAHICHTSRAKARYLAALEICDAGFASVSTALVKMRCTRAAWRDLDANCMGIPGWLSRR